MPPTEQPGDSFNSAAVVVALTPLAKLTDLQDDKALAALARLQMQRVYQAFDELKQAAIDRAPLDSGLSRLLAQIAGWLVAQNKPVPPDDGSRQWDQALSARLKVLDPMATIANALSNTAIVCSPSSAPNGRQGWDAGLRFRMLCAGAFCTDAAPQVLLAAWVGPRATAQRQQEAARLAKQLLNTMLHAAGSIAEEVSLADRPGTVGRLLERSAAAKDAKLLAFLTFAGQAAPGMLALAGDGLGEGSPWHCAVLTSLRVFVGADRPRLGRLIASHPAVGMGLLSLALEGWRLAMQALKVQMATEEYSGAGNPAAVKQLSSELYSERHDLAWQNGTSIVFAEPLVPAWRAVEEAARSAGVPYAAQAQQLRERAVAAALQLRVLLGMPAPDENDDAAAAAAAARVSLPWLGSQMAADMRHAAGIAAGTQQTEQALQEDGDKLAQPTQRQALQWVWRLAEAVACCAEVAATALFPLRRSGSSGSSGGSGGSSSSGSMAAARAAYLVSQLRHVSDAFAALLPTVPDLLAAGGRHAAFERFCKGALPAVADRLPAAAGSQLVGLAASASSAIEAAARAVACDMQQSASGPDAVMHALHPVEELGKVRSALRALCALQAAAAAVAGHSSASSSSSSSSGGGGGAAAGEQAEAAAAAVEAQPALLSLARSLAKMVLSELASRAAAPDGSHPLSASAAAPLWEVWKHTKVRSAGMALAQALCMLALSCKTAGGAHMLPKQARRHLDGTALAALAAADAIEAAWQHATQPDPDAAADGLSQRLQTPSVAAAVRAWALAAAADPASLPGGDATLLAVLDALPDVLAKERQESAIVLDALAMLAPRVDWLGPELCRRGLLAQALLPGAADGKASAVVTEATWRLMDRIDAQVAAALARQLPPADTAPLLQPPADAPAEELAAARQRWDWAAGLWHWSPEEAVAAASAVLQLPAAAPDGAQPEPSEPPAWLLDLQQGLKQLEYAVAEAGTALPRKADAATAEDAGEAEQQHQLAVARALKPLRCAHLGCTNSAGGSEAELPCRLCNGCRQVRYCSAECAAAAWRDHRPACKLMRPE